MCALISVQCAPDCAVASPWNKKRLGGSRCGTFKLSCTFKLSLRRAAPRCAFADFGIAGTDPLAVGLVPSLSSFDKTKRDGTNLPNPLAVQQFAKPQGTLRMFCAAHGVYQIKATQTVMPRRAGQLIFTNQQGCSLFASVDKLSLSGDSSEEGALGYFLVGSWGMPNGTAYATPAYGGSFTQCPVQVLDVAKTSRGWDGCGARNGTRVYMYWYGIGVYHSVRHPSPPHSSRTPDALSERRSLHSLYDRVPADSLGPLRHCLPRLLAERRVVASGILHGGGVTATHGDVRRWIPPDPQHPRAVVHGAGCASHPARSQSVHLRYSLLAYRRVPSLALHRKGASESAGLIGTASFFPACPPAQASIG